CHFIQDIHGNSKLYGEVRAAIEIQCIDCHGTVSERPTLRTSGPASDSLPGGRDLAALRTPFGKRRFELQGSKIFQNSMVEKDKKWEIPQVADIIDSGNPRYNAKAAMAKTVRFTKDDEFVWGGLPDQPGGKAKDGTVCAHQNKNMSCIACHS